MLQIQKIAVSLELLTARLSATTPGISRFTLPLPKIRAFFEKSSMFATKILKVWKWFRQTVCTFVNTNRKNAQFWIASEIVRNCDCEKKLQTKSALLKLMIWVQLKCYCKWSTHPKYSEYSQTNDIWMEWCLDGEMIKKWSKNAQKKPKNVENRSFSLFSLEIGNRS